MGRYRPPPPPKSPYITAEGALALRQEMKHLWEEERPKVTAAVSAAAKNGDRSENGDYIYGKRRLREIDRRVRYLSKRLEKAIIVNKPPADINKIYFGAWVTLEKEDGEMLKLRIVGSDEIDTHSEYISFDSPMTKALLGKSVDEEVFVKTPSGTNSYFILKISYIT